MGMEQYINLIGVYKNVILLNSEEELKKFRRMCKDWDKYIVILDKEIIIPSKLLNRKILSKIRNLIIKRDTSSKYENNKKITVHFYRIKLENPIESIINQNENIIDYKKFIENLVSQKYVEYYYGEEKKLNNEINKLEKEIKRLEEEKEKLNKDKLFDIINILSEEYSKNYNEKFIVGYYIHKLLNKNPKYLIILLENLPEVKKKLVIKKLQNTEYKYSNRINEINKKIEEYKNKIKKHKEKINEIKNNYNKLINIYK